jgi:ABC-type uncharacterized transport system permease subunit
LHEWIDIHGGQNLNFFNMFSLTAWLVSVLVLVIALARSVDVLALFVFPVAGISIILVIAFPSYTVINAAASPDTLFHILLAIVTFCVLCVAGLLAVLLAVQERFLQHKSSGWLVQQVSPLETMEALLFQVMGLGFVLLSVVLVTSIYFYSHLIFQNIFLIQKSLLTILAWVIFAVLLAGRYRFGWRGRRAIYGTLLGVLLLFLAYFGSKLLLHMLVS